MSWVRHAAACLLFLSVGHGYAVAGPDDYLPRNPAWNGTSELRQIAEGMQRTMRHEAELDWDALTPDTTLFFLYPTEPPSAEQVTRFVSRGGRVLIADDFGKSESLLKRLKITLHKKSPVAGYGTYRQNPALPLARAHGSKTGLTHRVFTVVTNHPGYFTSRHPTLIGFGGGGQLLVAGTVDKGMYVALADPSILLNAMLKFAGNAALARALVRETSEAGQEIVLVTGGFRQRGRQLATHDRSDRVAMEFNRFVRRANDFALTKAGMQSCAFGLGGLVVLALLWVMPLSRRQRQPTRWRKANADAPRRELDTAEGWLLLRDAVERVLQRALAVDVPIASTDARWLSTRVAAVAGEDAAGDCEALLRQLKRVPYGATSSRRRRRRRATDLARAYKRARRLCSALGAPVMAPCESPTVANTSAPRYLASATETAAAKTPPRP